MWDSAHPLSPRAIPLISHQDVIPSGWHQIPAVEMIQQEFTCRYPLQYEDRTFFSPKRTRKSSSIHPFLGATVFFCGHFLGPNELLFLPCPAKGGRSGLLRVADRPKFFLPFGRLSTRHPATQIRWKKHEKIAKQQNGSNPRNKGGLLLNKLCWAILLEVWRGWSQEMVALSGGYIRK